MKSRPAPHTIPLAVLRMAGWLMLLVFQCFGAFQAHGQGWQFSFGGEKTDEGWAVLQTEDHGFVVAGFGESFGDDNDQDIFILRMDVDGRVIWTTFYDEGYQEQPRAILALPDGNFLIVGTISKDIGASEDIYLLKINRKGEKLWSRQFGSSNIERVNAAAVRPDGSIVVAGFIRKDNEDEDMFAASFDPLGNVRWLKTYGTAKPDEATAVVLLSQGDVVIGGNSRNAIGFDNDIVLFRLDSIGTVTWEKRISNPYREEIRDMLLTQSGNIAIAGTVNNNSDAYVALFDTGGKLLWEKAIGETGKEEEANAIAELSSGNLVITGLKVTDMVNVDIFVAQLDRNGAVLWQKNIGDKTATEEARDIQPTADGGFIITGYNAQVLTSFNDLILIKTDGLGAVVSNYISGKVVLDEDAQCDIDPNERSLAGWLVQAESAKGVFYATTDENGNYQIAVDTGTYIVRALPLNLYWEACSLQGSRVQFSAFYDSVRVNFPMKPAVLCPYLEVEVATPFLAVCENLEYTVSYCNIGTAKASNAYVDLELDPKLTFLSADRSQVLLPNGKRRFLLGDLNPAACGRFVVKAQMACSGIAQGQSALVAAHIYPDTNCLRPSPDWDLSSLSVKGSCEGDSVVFKIRNDGTGDMRSSRRSIVIQDHIVLRQLDIQLKAQEETKIKIPAEGATFRAVVEQSAGHPGRSYPTAAVEGCVTPGNPFTTGLVTMFPENEADPFIGIDVQEIALAPQTVDLRAYPKGYRDSVIAPETDLTFKVLFKNTGRDTVTRIVIRDTLPFGFEPRKVVGGPASFPYKLDVYGNGIVRITIDNVSLPPRLPGSSGGVGFVEFRVGQRNGNPPGTVLENRASVFFNDQAPQNTRKVRYVVNKFPDFVTVLTSTRETFFPGASVHAYPNPSPGSVTFEVKGMPFQELRLQIFSPDGRQVQRQEFSGNEFIWNRNALSPGLYLYRLETEAGKLINTGKIILR